MKRIFVYKLLVLALIFFISCKDDNEVIGVDYLADHDILTTEIINLGFEKTQVKDFGNYFLVDDCYIFFKNKLKEKKYTMNKVAQAVTNTVVSLNKVQNIKVKYHQSVSNPGYDNWVNSIYDATDEWNDIDNCVINFTVNASYGDIVVYSDQYLSRPLPNYVIASAEFPNNGNPGNRIYINLDYYNNKIISESQKKYNMVHELGHCLGFRHTNWHEGPYPESTANSLPGTTYSDPNSVMNKGTAEYTWDGFSKYDKVASRALYPNYMTGTFKRSYRKWDYSLQDYVNYIEIARNSLTPFYTVDELQVLENGQWVKLYSPVYNSTTFIDRDWEVLPGRTYRAKIRNYNGSYIGYTQTW